MHVGATPQRSHLEIRYHRDPGALAFKKPRLTGVHHPQPGKGPIRPGLSPIQKDKVLLLYCEEIPERGPRYYGRRPGPSGPHHSQPRGGQGHQLANQTKVKAIRQANREKVSEVCDMNGLWRLSQWVRNREIPRAAFTPDIKGPNGTAKTIQEKQ